MSRLKITQTNNFNIQGFKNCIVVAFSLQKHSMWRTQRHTQTQTQTYRNTHMQVPKWKQKKNGETWRDWFWKHFKWLLGHFNTALYIVWIEVCFFFCSPKVFNSFFIHPPHYWNFFSPIQLPISSKHCSIFKKQIQRYQDFCLWTLAPC